MTQKIEFTGSTGEKLAAKLELPTTPPRAFAIFAHCFTCSKDTFAPTRIARSLTEHGIAVLRFDFTGLGASEGDFANTNFSTNVGDLVSAAAFLRDNYEAPQILIGHSLGGAAVLAAANQIPEILAVSTIGAPADVAHVLHNFGTTLEKVEKEGEADVNLAGRTFKIAAQFVTDAREQNLKTEITRLKRPLLIFHSPIDQTVGIENAEKIFIAAKHPKSYVSLDDADHLLSDRRDAVFVADVLSAWVAPYLDDEHIEPAKDNPHHPGVHVSETGTFPYQQEIVSGDHTFFADEPKSVGGADTGPSPYDLLSAGLGACTTMTMRMYANHKGFEVPNMAVRVTHAKVHVNDCMDCGEGRTGRIDRFERHITISDETPPETREKLLRIADRCPVHKTLSQSSVIATSFESE